VGTSERINELATNSKNKKIGELCRRIDEFKRGYQPRSNLAKDENGALLADSHNILNMWKNYFSEPSCGRFLGFAPVGRRGSGV
jgi:hypothetical protein